MAELMTNMTDVQVLAHYRQRYPYISLASAMGIYRTRVRFRHLGVLA